MTVALFCGSTGATGANRAALALVARLLDERGVAVTEAVDVAEIAILRADRVDDAPPPVQALRELFESADAVVLSTPEYGGGAAGGAKNALDWMVGSGSLYERPVAVMSVGTSGGANSIEQIARTLTWQGAFVVATLGIATPVAKRDSDGAFSDAATVTRTATMLDALLGAVAGTQEQRQALAASTVRGLGIDPFRRAGR